MDTEDKVSENSRNTIEWHPLYGNPHVVDFLRNIANEARNKERLLKNPLYLPPELTPPIGMVYSWGTYSVCGETHQTNIDRLNRTGHQPVPPGRHPELFSDDSVPGTISRKGSVLVEGHSQAAIDAIRELRYEREREEKLKIENKFFNRISRKIRRFFKLN